MQITCLDNKEKFEVRFYLYNKEKFEIRFYLYIQLMLLLLLNMRIWNDKCDSKVTFEIKCPYFQTQYEI